MTQRKMPGLRLVQKESPRTPWLTRTLGAMLVLAAQILTVTGLTGFDRGLPVMAVTGGYICIFYGILTGFRKKNWFFPTALGALLLAVLLLRRELGAGYCLFHNTFREVLTRCTGWTLPRLEVVTENKELAIGVFSAISAAAMGILSCFLAAHAPIVPALVLPIVAMGGMTLLGYSESPLWFGAVLGICLLLPVLAGGVRSPWVSWCGCILAFTLLTLCLGGVNTEDLAAQTRHSLHQWHWETGDTLLPEGDLTGTPGEVDGQSGLLVTMEQPEEMYLRGFVGTEFEENAWKSMDTAHLAEEGELLYWLNKNAFPLNAQFQAAAAPLGLESQSVTVKNLGACSQNAYVPFQLLDGEWLYEKNLHPDMVAAFGNRSYSYRVVSGGTEALSRVLEMLQTSDEASVLTYRRAESAYRDFVYRNYLTLPQELPEELKQLWDAQARPYGGVEKLDDRQARQCALEFLENYTGDGTFLQDWQGTGYQYATVAVLTLRYFGIPARYAEGYVITAEMAAGVPEGVAMEVDGSCASAWAEVYQDGIGWLPMSLTLGLEEAGGQTPPPTQQEQQPEEEPTEETPEEEPLPDGGSAVALTTVALYSLIGLLLALVLAFLILVCRRKILRSKVEKRFAGEDPREALGWIFADTANLLEAMGLSREGGSLRKLRPEASERFGEDYAARLDSMIDWNEMSLFSSRPMTGQQQTDMLAFRQETLTLLKKTTKWYKRFRMKWIRCLY